jgi:Domain of unknown function (DUF6457)
MSEWTVRLAAHLGVPALAGPAEGSLLRASRDVAHRVERKDTPLSAYLLGVAAGMRIANGTDPDVALDEVLALLEPALPPMPELGP